MRTPDLIDQLTADLRPVPQHAAFSRLAAGLLLGAVIALGCVSLTLGVRSDFASAVLTSAFWMKALFALSVAGVALSLCLRLGRPEGEPGRLPAILPIPFLVLGVLALFEMRDTPAGDRMDLWLGKSALWCPWMIGALAIPIFLGILWAFRKLAPTRQRLAGFCAGCLAGAASAVVYCVHCPEHAASFVATWYTAGILLPAVIGLWIGPRILRW